MLARRNTSSAGVTRGLVRLFTACENAIPSSHRVERFIESRQPDAVLVTPLVTARCRQADYVKAAQALGIPAAACIASWDHLTTKGLIRVRPDLVTVWNHEQQAEAEEFHAHYAGEHADWEAADHLMELAGVHARFFPPEHYQQFRQRFAGGHGMYPIVGDPDHVASELERIADAGFAGLAFSFVDYVGELDYFSAEVLPRRPP